MKIAFFIDNLNNKGGTERVTTVIANSLSKRKIIDSISILSINKGTKPAFKVDSSIKLFSLRCEKYNSLVKRFMVPKLLKKIIVNEKIDILICVNVGIYIYAKKLQKKGYCKTIVWEHFNYYNQHTWRDKLKKENAAKLANAFIVLSNSDLENYKRNIRNIRNIKRIYNPLTVAVANSLDKHQTREKKVIAVGRLVTQKGFDILIDVWKIVEENPVSNDWSLEIYGDGPEKYRLTQKIKDLKLKSIHINNFNADIVNEYKKSSIFVFSSRYEGFGLVLVEALANGVPAVSFDIKEGPNEIITNNVNGYLIPPFDKKKMAEKLLSLMKNNKKLLDFQENSTYGLEKFSKNVIVHDWEQLLGDVFEQR